MLIGLISFILLGSHTMLQAQESQSSTFELNIHAGITAGQVQGDGLSGFNKLGFLAGLGITTAFSEEWSAGFELNFIQKGSVKRSNAEAGDYTEYKMLLNYIQVPIYATYQVNSKFGFLGGPAVGILISNKEEDMYGEITGTPEFEKLELALVLGASYAFSEKWTAHIKHDQSLLPIRSKGDYSSNTLKGKQYNMLLSLSISYSLR